MEITYTRVGDYLLPDITLQEQSHEGISPLGYFARLHRDFLREHRSVLYSELVLSEKLFPILRQIDEAAFERMRNVSDSDKPLVVQGILRDLVYC